MSCSRVRSLPAPRLSAAECVSSRRQRSLLAAAANDVISAVPPTAIVEESRDLGWSRSFAEDYLLNDEEVLGEGSFGVVKPAINKLTGDSVAVKLLPKNVTGDWQRYSALLQREIEHWKLLKNCPQVVKMEGVYEDDDYLYIVQELCTGGDIQHLIRVRFEFFEIFDDLVK